MIEVERYHDFSAGHRVVGHEGKCAHLHGHNYRVYFTVRADVDSADLDAVGRVIDFGVIKSTLCQWLEDNWDHKFLISRLDPMRHYLESADHDGIVVVPFNPTAENMARYLVEDVGPVFLNGLGVKLVKCRIEETRKCSATYTLNFED